MRRLTILLVMTLGAMTLWAQVYNPPYNGVTSNGSGGLTIKAGPIFDVKAYGAVGDGTTDDCDAIKAAINAAIAAGGGQVYFPTPSVRYKLGATCQLLIGTTTPLDIRPTIRLFGDGATERWYAAAHVWTTPEKTSILDLQYHGTWPSAKIESLNLGILEIDHLTLLDTSTDCAPFVHVAYTTLYAHDNTIIGTTPDEGACNDAFVMGDATNGFAGYGYVIEKNFADQVDAFVAFNSTAGAGNVRANIVGLRSGSAKVGTVTTPTTGGSGAAYGAPVTFCRDGGTCSLHGINFQGNLYEWKHYRQVYWMGTGTTSNYFIGEHYWDPKCRTDGLTQTSGSGLNDLTLVGADGGACTLLNNQALIRIVIDGTGSPNTFKWAQLKNGAGNFVATGVAITGGTQTLTMPDGTGTVTIKFNATTGHTLNDTWQATENYNMIFRLNGSGGNVIQPAWTDGVAGQALYDAPTVNRVSTTATNSAPGSFPMENFPSGIATWSGAMFRTATNTAQLTNCTTNLCLSVDGFTAGDAASSMQMAGNTLMTNNSAKWIQGSASEFITLSTSGATTDSSANLLPADSLIEGVACRVMVTITTATNWSVGDASTAGRFIATNSTLTAGTTAASTGTAWTTGIASATTGMKQGSAAKLRITTTGTPGAGIIRCTVFYSQFVAPTS